MRWDKRYKGTERDKNGKLLSTFSYSTPEEFDRHVSQYPPVDGHVLILYDSWNPLDCFGICFEVVRKVVGS